MISIILFFNSEIILKFHPACSRIILNHNSLCYANVFTRNFYRILKICLYKLSVITVYIPHSAGELENFFIFHNLGTTTFPGLKLQII